MSEAILSGELESGEPIVEGRVAQEFGVGQGVLCEALIELEHQGFVQRTPYSGTRVMTLTHDDAKHIYDLRILLEPLAFVRAAPHIDGKPLRELKRIVERMRKAYVEEDLVKQFQQQLAWRQLVWSLSGNEYLVRALEQLVPPQFALYLIRAAFSRANREDLLQTIGVALESQRLTIEACEHGDVEGGPSAGGEFSGSDAGRDRRRCCCLTQVRVERSSTSADYRALLDTSYSSERNF